MVIGITDSLGDGIQEFPCSGAEQSVVLRPTYAAHLSWIRSVFPGRVVVVCVSLLDALFGPGLLFRPTGGKSRQVSVLFQCTEEQSQVTRIRHFLDAFVTDAIAF